MPAEGRASLNPPLKVLGILHDSSAVVRVHSREAVDPWTLQKLEAWMAQLVQAME